MWLDDCVHYEVAKAMVIRDIMNEREAEKPKETFREYWERTRGVKLDKNFQKEVGS